MRILLIAAVYLLSLTGLSLTFECPANEYPYGDCSSCFSVVNRSLSFNSASQFCKENGGTLLSIRNTQQFVILGRYLEGLLEQRQLWIGYRYNSAGIRVGLDGQMASSIILNDTNFFQSTLGGLETCIAVEQSNLVNVDCVQARAFVCMYTYGVPQVTRSPQDKILHVATSQSNFTLSAIITSPDAPAVTAEWRRDGITISPNQGGYIVTAQEGVLPSQKNFSLLITTFNPAMHTGIYELIVASRTGTTVSAIWQLNEAVLGDITIQPQDVTILTGQIAGFECEAGNALPRPTISWYRDSIPLDVSSDPRLYVSDVTGTLFVRNVSGGDGGSYQCVLENGVGRVSSRPANLTVVSSLPANMVSFSIHPRPHTILAGNPYSLECVGMQTYNTSSTRYNFFFNQASFFTEPNAVVMYPSDNQFPVYRIEAVSVGDSTDCASCTISPEMVTGFSQIEESEKVAITVHSLARVTQMTTTVKNGTETSSNIIPVPSGSDIKIQCHFSGVPIPNTVEWTLNGIRITVGVVTGMGVSTLRVSDVRSDGVYQCTVGNLYGRDTGSISVCIEEQESLPGPVSFTAQPNTLTSLHITWDNPLTSSTHPLLLRYEIRVQQVSSESPVSHFPPPGANSFIVPGLSPGELYQVSVVAMSLLGTGASPSQETHIRTFSEPIMEIVNGLTARRTEDNSAFIVQWEPFTVETTAPIIPLYEVEYRLTGGSVGMTIRTGDTLLVVEELDDAASYEIRIRLLTQTQRDPAQFAPGPWSGYIEVEGVITLPSQSPEIPSTGGVLSPMEQLLIYICVPVGVVLLVMLGVVLLVICLCHYHTDKKKRSYRPSKKERGSRKSKEHFQHQVGPQVGPQTLSIMGNIHRNADETWVENNCYAPVLLPPNVNEKTTSNYKKNGPTNFNKEPSTPEKSIQSGTVTITYLNDDSSGGSSPIRELEPVTPRSGSEFTDSPNNNGASAKTDLMTRIHSPGSIQSSTPTKSVSLESGNPAASVSDPFHEATSAADDLYKLAISLETDITPRSRPVSENLHTRMKTNNPIYAEPRAHRKSESALNGRRISDEYDSLEPSRVPEVGGGAYEVSVFTGEDDFQVLDELAAESAAMAVQSGIPDPFAYTRSYTEL